MKISFVLSPIISDHNTRVLNFEIKLKNNQRTGEVPKLLPQIWKQCRPLSDRNVLGFNLLWFYVCKYIYQGGSNKLVQSLHNYQCPVLKNNLISLSLYY